MTRFNLRTTSRTTFALLFCAFLGLLGAGCSAGTTGADIDPTELLERIDRGDAPLVLDVRSPGEYASAHVPGAVNVPFDQLAARLDELGAGHDDEVVVYCESGGRARMATSTLQGAGFTSVRHLSGDMAGWRAANRRSE